MVWVSLWFLSLAGEIGKSSQIGITVSLIPWTARELQDSLKNQI